jgi:hypothetical protein
MTGGGLIGLAEAVAKSFGGDCKLAQMINETLS